MAGPSERAPLMRGTWTGKGERHWNLEEDPEICGVDTFSMPEKSICL